MHVDECWAEDLWGLVWKTWSADMGSNGYMSRFMLFIRPLRNARVEFVIVWCVWLALELSGTRLLGIQVTCPGSWLVPTGTELGWVSPD